MDTGTETLSNETLSKDQEAYTRLEGQNFSGGEFSRGAMGGLLGLRSVPRPVPVEVVAVSWANRSVEVLVKIEGAKEILFTLERPTEDRNEGIILTDHLVVQYKGGELPTLVSESVERYGRKRLADYTLEKLAVVISGDPELGQRGNPSPVLEEPDDRPAAHITAWGLSDVYANFFAWDEISRAQLDSLDVSKFVIYVQHADQECNFVDPHGIAPVVSLVNYPWNDRFRDNGRPFKNGPSDIENYYEQSYCTDLNDDDVIMGNPGKVEKVLDISTAAAERLGKMVMFANTCVPITTGEDVQSEYKRNKESCDCSLSWLTISASSMEVLFEDTLHRYRLEVEERPCLRDPRAVNLVGFSDSRDVHELTNLLGRCGIRVNTVIIPDLSLELIDGTPRAALNVIQPNCAWQHIFDQFTRNSKVPFIAPKAPYGVEGSRRWVERIAEELGLDVDVGRVLEEAFADRADEFARLKEGASKHRLAIVLRQEETFYLTGPEFAWGVPIVEFLEELGYSLDIFVMFANRKQAVRATREVYSMFTHPERHVIKGFNSFEMLLERLESSECHAVLSYHFFDWRVTQSGKNLFSLQHVERGILGAHRTMERINRICETTFFSRYSKYLRRSPEGLPLGV